MKKSSIKENPLQIHLISWKIHSKLVSTILEFFFPKVDCKSMDDMGISEIVSEVLFGPNILERHPAWQVSSLKKIFWFFVCPLLPKLEGPTLDKILILFLTLFFFNEKVKNLKICLWRDHIRTCDGPKLFWEIVSRSFCHCSKKDFHFEKISNQITLMVASLKKLVFIEFVRFDSKRVKLSTYGDETHSIKFFSKKILKKGWRTGNVQNIIPMKFGTLTHRLMNLW